MDNIDNIPLWKQAIYLFRYCDIVAFFEGFFDESGTHSGSPTIAVAGAIAKQSDWSLILDSWIDVLSKPKFNVSHFHASELAHFRGPYKGWDKQKQIDLSRELLDVINGYDIVFITVAVPRLLYEKVLADFPSVKLNPYGFCCMCAVDEVIRYIRETNKGTVSLVFGKGQDFESQPSTIGLRDELLFPRVKDYYQFDGLRQGSREEFRQLEVADLIAYESYKHWTNRIQRTGRPPRKSLVRLVNGNRNVGGLMNEEGVRQYLSTFDVLWNRESE